MSSSDGLKRQVLPDEEFNCSAVRHSLLAAILDWIMRVVTVRPQQSTPQLTLQLAFCY
jgi:hypothetical protein